MSSSTTKAKKVKSKFSTSLTPVTSLTPQKKPNDNDDLIKNRKGTMGPLKRNTKQITGSRKRKMHFELQINMIVKAL